MLLGVLGYLMIKGKEKISVEEAMRGAISSHAILPEIRRKAAELTKYCDNNEIRRIERIYRFVADQIGYMPDPWDEEYFANALETLYVGAGDCDCKCILLATLLRANGFKVAIDLIPEHVLVEVYVTADYVDQMPSGCRRPDPESGGEWILLESTAVGAEIGWVSNELFETYLSRGRETRFEI